MSDASVPESVRLAAEHAELGKALKLFPEAVKAAYERGTRPIGEHAGVTPIASPASTFNPARFEKSK